MATADEVIGRIDLTIEVLRMDGLVPARILLSPADVELLREAHKIPKSARMVGPPIYRGINVYAGKEPVTQVMAKSPGTPSRVYQAI
jgi:hypothetical protein